MLGLNGGKFAPLSLPWDPEFLSSSFLLPGIQKRLHARAAVGLNDEGIWISLPLP